MSTDFAGAEVESLDFDPFADGELERVVPATPPQVEIWLADRLAPQASLAYNESESFVFEGHLDQRALTNALHDLIQRHDALRSTLGPDGQSLCVSELAQLAIQGHDLEDLEGQAQAARVRDFTTQAVETPFSLEHGPLLRATLLRLGPTRHQLILTVHHAVCDGWSWGVLKRELALLYSGHARGTHPARELRTAPSFAQYAEQVALQAGGDQAKSDLSFWKGVYATDAPVMELPLDRPRPALRTFRAGFVTHTIEAALVAQVKRTAAQAGASLFSTLLASFAIVMGRLSVQSDVVVGVAAAGQTLDGNEDMVGHAVSMLPIRLNWNDDDAFAAVVQRAQAHVFDAMEHQRLTYGELLKVLDVPRDPSRLPLVSVLFNIDAPIPAAQMQFAGLETRTHTNPRSFENYELFVNAVETVAGVVLQAQFNADLFDSSTVMRWLGGLEVFLRSVGTSLERPVRDVSLMTPADAALLERWNGTDTAYETGLRLGDLIQRGVLSHPAAVAVRFEGRDVSYAELNSMAWALANKLRDMGVKPGGLVGVCLERSVELVAALVGVVYSGGAYVPLDPSYPPERLTHMCEDAHMDVIVTRGAELAGAGSAFALGIQLVRMDEVWLGLPTPAGKLVGTPEDPAYVIFTSGSTGRPKGAMNAHKGIVNRLQWTQQEYPLTPQDRVMQKTPYSFDVSVWEFFWPLMTGSTIVVARPDGHRDPGYIAQLIQDEAVSLLHFVPSMLRLFLEEPRGGQCRSLRQVLCSGEALPIDVVDRFFESIGQARLGNLYGPTEAAVDVTFWNCVPGDARRIVPIGRPVANTRMYVLDAQLRQLPIGQQGELYIGGIQVGMGYVSRPDLSAERFVPDPFNPGGRMYKTGDVARWLNDGAIDYLGRADHQVKIRGNRIELGEIELALGSHADVSHVVVMAREDVPGDTRLVAYLVAAGAPVAAGQLQAHLRSSLPEYMVPQQYVWLLEIPLLPNGKINRKALPAPGVEAQGEGRAIRQPTTPTEIVLADLWRSLLRVEHIGTEDNFIALGGHSLLLMRMASQIKSKLGLALPVRDYFVAPTLADLARRLDAVAAPTAISTAGRIRARAQQVDAPLSLMQERLWFMESLHPGRVVYHIEGGMRLRGRLDEDALEGAVQALLDRQSALRTVFVNNGSDSVAQRVVPELKLPLFPAEDLSALPAAQREFRLVQRLGELANRAFQLRGAPLVRMHLLKLASDEHALFLMMHHLVFDGWSMTVLLRELAELYRAHLLRATPRLPALPVSYGDFSVWHREWTQSDAARSQVGHWCNKLQGLGEPLALQTDFPRPPQPSNLAGAVELHLPRALTNALKAVGQSEDATLFMTALAGYYALLHLHTGQTDFVVGFPVRGRNDAELEDLIGYFANVLPLRLTVQPDQTFREVLRNTRQAVLEALDHADAPFEQVVRELGLPRDESRFPVYQTLFAFQDTRGVATQWGDLQGMPLPETVDAVAEDLAVWMVERDDGLSAKLAYASDLFAAESIELLAQRYVRLLESAARMPEQTVGELPILLDRERVQLRSWNATDQPLDARASVSGLLQHRMREHADSPAVAFGSQTWLMGELQARANRLAHLLRAKGVGRGALVGLCLERSPQMLAAQLAVLWSGAAYVPLDPAYPAERLTHMAEDADLALVLTDHASRQSLNWRPEQTLCLEDAADAIAEQPDVPLSTSDALAARPQDPAYVIFTSGSTGKPKGVVVPHSAVVNFLTSMADRPGMTHGDRILAVTTISFDIAVLELLLPLSVGACILLATREQTMDGHSLRELLEQGNATMMQATPSTWRLLLAAGWNGSSHFKALTGGEALPIDLAQQLIVRSGALWNMYGPTETTVWSTCCRIDAHARRIDIGAPIANTQVHVLDSRQRHCPIGVPGEIYIAGAGVALGYLNRPELSAERFVPNPYGPPDLGRMYRTGDLGRWLGNGSLEHLGRLDHQVKVRGHRIELGEIEACLAGTSGVANNVVVVREDPKGAARIVAYLVARQAPVAISDLKAHLRAFLPEYMLPQVFIWLPEIPLLPNGKIDRKALPASAEVKLPRNDVDDNLNTPNEAAIAAIWSNILGLPSISASDNFFDLGGHSLLAMQALAQMKAELGTNYELRQLIFESLGSIAATHSADSAASTESLPRIGLVSRFTNGIKSKILRIRS